MYDLPPVTGHGAKDRERYRSKIEDALRRGLQDIITGESIIDAPDGTKVRVRVADIHEPRFRRPDPRGTTGGVGAGDGGDPIATVPVDGEGGSGSAGTEHEDGYVYVDVPLTDVAQWVFSELALPKVKPKAGAEDDETDALTARGKQGAILDRRRTLLQHRLREVAAGEKRLPWSDHDLIYRRWHEKRTPSIQAVVILARDASGSITQEQQYIMRVASWWIVLWLRQTYPLVRVRFILHDTQAVEVTEEDWFQGRTMGGTAISSGLTLAERILDAEYPQQSWNRYVVEYSDGENWTEDDAKLHETIRRLAQKVELLAYGQVQAGDSTTLQYMREMERDGARSGYLTTTSMIGPWLQSIFGKGGGERRGSA